MIGKGAFYLTSEMSPEPRQSTEQTHGCRIELRPLSAPLRQDFVNVIHIRLHQRPE